MYQHCISCQSSHQSSTYIRELGANVSEFVVNSNVIVIVVAVVELMIYRRVRLYGQQGCFRVEHHEYLLGRH